MRTRTSRRKTYPAGQDYCFVCERELLLEREKFGPVCSDCHKKARRKDPLALAAAHGTLVVSVPALCPHHEMGDCRFFRTRPRFWNVMVLDRNLEPIRIFGPYRTGEAEREVDRLRTKFERKNHRKRRL
jgi:hypothetical protein